MGGETFVAGDTITIEWKEVIKHNTTGWDLFYSSDSGATFNAIATVPWDSINATTYDWKVPNSVGNNFKVYVTQVTPGPQEYTSSSEVFTIETSNVSVQEKTKAAVSFTIYPNPTTGIINIDSEPATIDNKHSIQLIPNTLELDFLFFCFLLNTTNSNTIHIIS